MKLQLQSDDGKVLWELTDVTLDDFEGGITLGLSYLQEALQEHEQEALREHEAKVLA